MKVKKDYLECAVLFHLTTMILFSDRRKGEELHVLERLQRKVKNCNTSFTFLRISCSFGRPFASMFPPIFSVNFVVQLHVGCICECPLIFRLSRKTLLPRIVVSLFFPLFNINFPA